MGLPGGSPYLKRRGLRGKSLSPAPHIHYYAPYRLFGSASYKFRMEVFP